MIDALLSAAQIVTSPTHLLFVFLGVMLGLTVGAIPGLTGLVGLSLLLPFTFDMEPTVALVMMMGVLAVQSTGDTIPSVMFGIPGTGASQATILDGYPMAQRGEAGRALAAAYMSSMMGGIIGAVVLVASIPILRPAVLALGSPEFFMLGMVGLSLVSLLSGRSLIKGLVVASLGLMAGSVGMDPYVGFGRWTFGQPYLWDGLPLVPVVMGIFAIPEVIDLLIKGTTISNRATDAIKGRLQGIRDALRNWWLVVRCSGIGVFVGFIPGLGGAVVDWFAYGYAQAAVKGAKETFGKGDVRGVIAPESANNAKEGGALIPTLAFGVPGTSAMAIMLAAFTYHGLTPGRAMMTTNLQIPLVLVWSLVIANVMGTAITLAFSTQFARLASLRVGVLAPVLMVVVVLGAFQSTRHFGDLVVLVAFTLVGWFMKRFGWPRPPLILGFILSSMLESYLYVSMQLYGFTWVTRPLVMVMIVVIVFVFLRGLAPGTLARVVAPLRRLRGGDRG